MRVKLLKTVVLSVAIELLTACGGGGTTPDSSATVLAAGSDANARESGSAAVTDSTVTLSALRFSQVLDRLATDPSLRLTPLRPVLVRMLATAQRAGIANPGFTLDVSNHGVPLGKLTMTGPALLPTAPAVDDLAASYNVVVPAAWMTTGVSFDATLHTPINQSQTAAPAVGAQTSLHVMLVPLQIGARVGVVPPSSEVHDALARRYPYASDAITVDVHATMAVDDMAALVTASDMATALGQVIALRASEQTDTADASNFYFYYGFIPAQANLSGLAGLGSTGVSGIERLTPSSAVGTDATAPYLDIDPFAPAMPWWAPTLLHELGHNHGLHHAPCGDAPDIDPGYPYPGGLLSTSIGLYDSLYDDDLTIGRLASATLPAGVMPDVMGYCAGIFFSDYNYDKVQGYAEALTLSLGRASAGADAATSRHAQATAAGSLTVTATMDALQVTLRARRTSSAAMSDADLAQLAGAGSNAASRYAVEVRFASGASQSYPVLPTSLVDAEGVSLFSVRLPEPFGAQAATVTLTRSGQPLAQVWVQGGALNGN